MLEVAIGMLSCYCTVSLIVSSINEGVASMLPTCAANLLGVQKLLNDPNLMTTSQGSTTMPVSHPSLATGRPATPRA